MAWVRGWPGTVLTSLRNTKAGQMVAIPPWGGERIGEEDAREKGDGEEEAGGFSGGEEAGEGRASPWIAHCFSLLPLRASCLCVRFLQWGE